MPDLVLRAREGRVLVLTLNRPEKRNALNAALRAALLEALAEARADDAVGAVVLTGAGEAFAAGADVKEMQERSTLEQRDFISPPHIYGAVAALPKPVLAAVHGLALGAGCELAMACDVRIAAATARLGQPEINLGLIPGGGGTQRLPRLVGPGRAARMVLTGDWIDAATAERWGLVDEVVAAEELMPRTLALAARMAERSPLALRLAKEALRAAEDLPLSEGLRREIDVFSTLFPSEDRREGVAAFVEKRPPSWKGR